MEIHTGHFRDKKIMRLAVHYCEESETRFAEFTVKGYENDLRTYRITGLSYWYVLEDYSCLDISHCTLIMDESGVFLSLDPYLEHKPSKEKDNWLFIGERIELLKTGN